MRRERGGASELGQSTAEWTGLVLLVALALVAAGAAIGARLTGSELASTVAGRIACAAGLGETGCAGVPDAALVAEYGTELAAEVRRRVPTLVYEEGMRALPVDFRSCREDPCSLGSTAGRATATDAGEPVTLFVHVIDCRDGTGGGGDYDCAEERADRLYVQYWAYYPGSQSLRALPGAIGHHQDDWESLQLRIGAEGTEVRASSHHGYNHRGGPANWLSDAGLARRDAWGVSRRRYYVSGGSHAGHAWEPPGARHRWTPGRLVRLVPIEAIARGPWGATSFAVTPPWRKRVYRDPEDHTTE